MTLKIHNVEDLLTPVTPEDAQNFLDNHNKMNRSFSTKEANKFAELLLAGEFAEGNGETVIFDEDGEIVSGQHRLGGIVRSGIPANLILVGNVPARHRPTVDDTRKRKFADDLAMNGIANSNQKATLIRKIALWEKEHGMANYRRTTVSRRFQADLWGMTNPQTGKTYHKEVEAALNVAERHKRRWPGSQGSLTFIAWLLQAEDEKTVGRYLSILSIGSQDENDKLLVWLHDLMLASSTLSEKIARRRYGLKPVTVPEEIYYLIRAWNEWVTNSHITKIGLPDGGLSNPYPYPTSVRMDK